MNRRTERGYALITAIVLAVLYFGLMQLMLIESSRELAEARRFRARIVALTLAENAIELAAAGMIKGQGAPVELTDEQGTAEQTVRKINGSRNSNGQLLDGTFELEGKGETSGAVRQSATAWLQGRIVNGQIIIDYARHQ